MGTSLLCPCYRRPRSHHAHLLDELEGEARVVHPARLGAATDAAGKLVVVAASHAEHHAAARGAHVDVSVARLAVARIVTRDTERADLDREQKELAADPKQEHGEMTAIYVGRGLDAGLASNVATQLMEHDALGAHGRDELGISETSTAKPVQAAVASAVTFSVGAALPLLIVLLVPGSTLMWAVSGSSLVVLALVGSLAASLGGASVVTAGLS